MTKHIKMLDRMRNNPRDWRIQDIQTLADHYGVDYRHDGGSHYVFSYPGIEQDVCVLAHRPIKPLYVRNFLALLDTVRESRR